MRSLPPFLSFPVPAVKPLMIQRVIHPERFSGGFSAF